MITFDKKFLLRGTSIALSLAWAGGAFAPQLMAQDAPDCADVDADGECDVDQNLVGPEAGANTANEGGIIVTGSRIRRPNLNRQFPLLRSRVSNSFSKARPMSATP